MDNSVEAVRTVIHRVARDRSGTDPGRIEEHHRLTVDLGLKSLDLARIVAALEIELGVDPFARSAAITDMRTVGDLCDAYGRGSTSEDEAPDELARSRRRAEARLAAPGRSRRASRVSSGAREE